VIFAEEDDADNNSSKSRNKHLKKLGKGKVKNLSQVQKIKNGKSRQLRVN